MEFDSALVELSLSKASNEQMIVKVLSKLEV